MNTALTEAIVSASLFTAVLIGMWLRRLLPDDRVSPNTRDTVKLAMGLLVTMSALVLGLLVSSAKGTYDTTRSQVIQMAAKVALLDRVLGIYGPEGAAVRRDFRDLVEGQIRRMWSGEVTGPARQRPGVQAGDEFYAAIQQLSPRDDAQRALKAQAGALTLELAHLRSLMLAQATSSISKPMLTVVVFWLVVIFLSFSALAPPNIIANLGLMVSALCVAAALCLILELDRPFEGLIQISSQPLQNALGQLGQ